MNSKLNFKRVWQVSSWVLKSLDSLIGIKMSASESSASVTNMLWNSGQQQNWFWTDLNRPPISSARLVIKMLSEMYRWASVLKKEKKKPSYWFLFNFPREKGKDTKWSPVVGLLQMIFWIGNQQYDITLCGIIIHSRIITVSVEYVTIVCICLFGWVIRQQIHRQTPTCPL